MINNLFLSFLVILIRNRVCYNSDITTYDGSKTDGVTCQFGLKQIIKEPTHIIGDSSSCIDQVFTTQPNLVTDSAILSSLHANCHQHIMFCEIQS